MALVANLAGDTRGGVLWSGLIALPVAHGRPGHGCRVHDELTLHLTCSRTLNRFVPGAQWTLKDSEPHVSVENERQVIGVRNGAGPASQDDGGAENRIEVSYGGQLR